MAKKPLKTNDKSTMLRRHKRSFINRPLETSPISDSDDFNLEIDDTLFNLQGLTMKTISTICIKNSRKS